MKKRSGRCTARTTRGPRCRFKPLFGSLCGVHARAVNAKRHPMRAIREEDPPIHFPPRWHDDDRYEEMMAAERVTEQINSGSDTSAWNDNDARELARQAPELKRLITADEERADEEIRRNQANRDRLLQQRPDLEHQIESWFLHNDFEIRKKYNDKHKRLLLREGFPAPR